MSTQFPSYKNPPVSEVAFGCQFAPLDNWKIPHTGIFWQNLCKEFPVIEHAPTLFNEEGGFTSDAATGFPLPRQWFINSTDSRLIQFQTDRFYYNWRKRDSESAYPRFKELSEKYSTYLSELEKFVVKQELGVISPVAYELTYINNIEIDANNDLAYSVNRQFNDINWVSKKRFLPSPTNLGWSCTFPLPDDLGTLQVKLNHARRVADGVAFFLLELTARGINPQASLSNSGDWFAVAHEWIVKGFADLTTEDSQVNSWGRE